MFDSLTTRTLATVRRMIPGSAPHTPDAGMATAEYAVATVAACGFGGVLYKLLSSDAVLQLLMDLVKQALSFIL